MNLNKDKLDILSNLDFLTRYNQLLNDLHEGKPGLPIIIEEINYNPKHYFRRTGSDPGLKTKFQETLNLKESTDFPKFNKKSNSKNKIILVKGKNRDWLITDIKDIKEIKEIQGKKRNWKVETKKKGGKKYYRKKQKTRKKLFKF